MQNSCYTRLKEKGAVLSFDAMLAVFLFIGVLVIGQVVMEEQAVSIKNQNQLVQLANDAFTVMNRTGAIEEELDLNGFALDSLDNIRNRALALMPQGYDLNLVLKQYVLDTVGCRNNKDFENCFRDENIEVLSVGSELPANKDLAHGKKVFIKKQPPGSCEVEESAEFSEAEIPLSPELQDIMFKLKSRNQELLFQGSDVNVDFTVTVNPSTEAECDQNIYVTISVSVNDNVRKPVDLMLVIDRSGSMDEHTQLIKQTSGSIGGGTADCSWVGCSNYQNWVQLTTFDIDDLNAFDAKLMWADSCSGDHCPHMYVLAPSGADYGFGRGAPTGGERSEGETYSYIRVPAFLSENGTWEVWGWNDNPAIDYDLFIQTIPDKITAARTSATAFVDYNGWQMPPDQIGLVSYSSSATLNQQLTTNPALVTAAISGLSPSGYTYTGEGIQEATDELGSLRANPDALKFQVLLSDGQSTDSTTTAANNAAAAEIKIYTIGFGYDADVTELSNIASITGGTYYHATDLDALLGIYELIARQIEEQANDSNVQIPLLPGEVMVDLNGGTIIDGNLVFDTGDITPGTPFEATYIVNFPCNLSMNCDFDFIEFPGPGTKFTYTDVNGTHSVDWNESVIIDFKSRDLTVNFVGGEILTENLISLDVNAANIDDLNSMATLVNFYLGDPDSGGTLIGNENTPFLCGGKDPLCVNPVYLFSELLASQGDIYAVINDDNSVAECPGNNRALIHCYSSPQTEFYVLEYWVWLK